MNTNVFNKYAEESEKYVQLVKMEQHLCDTKKDLLPTNNAGNDILVTLVFSKPELQMRLDNVKRELRELRDKQKKKMGPMMIIGGIDTSDKEEALLQEIASIEEEMSMLNVTLPLDILYSNQMLDVLLKAVKEEKDTVKQNLIPLVVNLGLTENSEKISH